MEPPVSNSCCLPRFVRHLLFPLRCSILLNTTIDLDCDAHLGPRFMSVWTFQDMPPMVEAWSHEGDCTSFGMLGLHHTATIRDIGKRKRHLSLHVHPDKVHGEGAKKAMDAISIVCIVFVLAPSQDIAIRSLRFRLACLSLDLVICLPGGGGFGGEGFGGWQALQGDYGSPPCPCRLG